MGLTDKVSRVRVLSLSDYYGSWSQGTGGAGNSAVKLAKILHDAGALAGVVAGFQHIAEGDLAELCFSLGGEDFRETVRDSPLNYARAIWNFKAAHSLRDWLSQVDPQSTIICLHQWTRSLTPACLRELRNFRCMIYIHDYFWMCPTGAYFNFNTEKPCELDPLSFRCLATNCDRVGHVDKAYRVVRHVAKKLATGNDSYKQIFIHISEVSRNAVQRHLPEHKHYVLNHSVESQLHMPRSLPRYDLGYFGRIEPEKGVLPLAEVAKFRDLKILFVGSGSAVEKIREKIPHAKFVDWASKENVITLLRQCRAVVLPSLWPETWGLIVPEALSVGVPVIVSGRAGSSEIIAHHGGGKVFDPGVSGSLDDAIQRLMNEDWRANEKAALESFSAAELDDESYRQKFDNVLRDAWKVSIY